MAIVVPSPAPATTTPAQSPPPESRSGIIEASISLTPFFVATLVVALWVACFGMGAIINSQPYKDYLNAASIASPVESTLTVKTDALASKLAADPKSPVTQADLAAALKANIPKGPVGPTMFKSVETEAAISTIFSFSGLIALFFVLLTFTPPNLAILSALAAVAGAAGRWMTDGTSLDGPANNGKGYSNNSTMPFSRWVSGVLLSALARGFFVYLALLSGLLVLTGDPFDNPTPGQYVRLAGTCSLFCFIVGWQPGVLSGMINRFITVSQLEKNPASKFAGTGVPSNTSSATEPPTREIKPVLAVATAPESTAVVPR
jgi:hypothetical protein